MSGGEEGKTRIATLAKNSREALAIELSEWKTYKLLQLRIVVPGTGAEPERPTAKAFGVRVDLIGALIDALQSARAEALRIGWLSHDPTEGGSP